MTDEAHDGAAVEHPPAEPVTRADAGRELFAVGLRVVAVVGMMWVLRSAIDQVAVSLATGSFLGGIGVNHPFFWWAVGTYGVKFAVGLVVWAAAPWCARVLYKRGSPAQPSPRFGIDGRALLRVGFVLLGVHIVTMCFRPIMFLCVLLGGDVEPAEVSSATLVLESVMIFALGLVLIVLNGALANLVARYCWRERTVAAGE